MAVTANIGGVNYSSSNSATPYQDIYNQYAKQQRTIRDAYTQRLADDKTAKEGEVNSQYNANNQRNYINYMQAKKNLPSELNAAGINGGATESSLLRLGTNYGSNVAENESGRAANLAALAQTYASKQAEYDEEFDNKLQSAYLTMLENQNKYEQEQREKDLQYFANSITGRYSDVKDYQELIKQLKASSDPNKNYKIALAEQAMNALKKEQEQAALAKSSSRSSGYRSYGGGYSNYGGSSSSSDTGSDYYIDATPLSNALAKAAVSTAKSGSNVKSSTTSTKPKQRNYMGTGLGYYQFK